MMLLFALCLAMVHGCVTEIKSGFYCGNWGGGAAVGQYATPLACATRCQQDFGSIMFAAYFTSRGYSNNYCECVQNGVACDERSSTTSVGPPAVFGIDGNCGGPVTSEPTAAPTAPVPPEPTGAPGVCVTEVKSGFYCGNWGGGAEVGKYATPLACATRCQEDFGSIMFAAYFKSRGYVNNYCECVQNGATCDERSSTTSVGPPAVFRINGNCGPTPTTEPPTGAPTLPPTPVPTETPTGAPTMMPTSMPSESPTGAPTELPTLMPTGAPTQMPTGAPTTSSCDQSEVLQKLSEVLSEVMGLKGEVGQLQEEVTTLKMEVNKTCTSAEDPSGDGTTDCITLDKPNKCRKASGCMWDKTTRPYKCVVKA